MMQCLISRLKIAALNLGDKIETYTWVPNFCPSDGHYAIHSEIKNSRLNAGSYQLKHISKIFIYLVLYVCAQNFSL